MASDRDLEITPRLALQELGDAARHMLGRARHLEDAHLADPLGAHEAAQGTGLDDVVIEAANGERFAGPEGNLRRQSRQPRRQPAGMPRGEIGGDGEIAARRQGEDGVRRASPNAKRYAARSRGAGNHDAEGDPVMGDVDEARRTGRSELPDRCHIATMPELLAFVSIYLNEGGTFILG